MKLRIHVEERTYDVEVEILDDPSRSNGVGAQAPAIPLSVLRPREPQKLPEDSVCRCPIAGQVTQVMAAVGQKVRKNQVLVIIEAMKMETPIGPAVDGVVKAIHVRSGDAVKTGQVLLELD